MHAARKLIVAIYSRRDREKSSAQVDFCCGEGQTEGAMWSATLQQGLIQR